MDAVTERISTVDDGPGTVNERLSTGGPGPEGQADTVTERLSGQSTAMPARGASKATWVEYAVGIGADREAAEAGTKQALIDEYDKD